MVTFATGDVGDDVSGSSGDDVDDDGDDVILDDEFNKQSKKGVYTINKLRKTTKQNQKQNKNNRNRNVS